MSTPPVAIVTGAAGGIGSATVEALLARGYAVSAWDIQEENLERLPAQADRRRVDLCNLNKLEQVVDEVVNHFGRIDLLVNNAIWREIVPISEITIESWEETLRIGLTVPAFLSRWVADRMTSRGGVIVNISSIMANRAGGISPAYVAAKGGLDALTYELAVTLAPRKIRVVGLRPGAIDTALSRDYGEQESEQDDGAATDEMAKWSCEHIPLQRWAKPHEIASLIAMVADDDASYLTGTIIDVDGGWSHAHFPRSLQAKALGRQ